ncbi:membrane fusion protein, multidrug efflux system/membrane fusion protein, multidrug efflux system [Stigmatella aurantiaca]|uniref:Membrane fusion protein, multidrug efflux system/membrane fusion protein, multidrug efflux system n=1 Tax=Stigmatella aurantiaca TaxID=41 RepID=A0A1H7YQH3_STIAU|nr:efflux RND transporter periplasmic adaptor subunit [Stigmatella aurantiaca]SEM47547.1 membrane fusion protein, multidrug efflux system/membrane fusion protein, multidrug efflux system [Stigmatella aurantiaca]
MAPVQAGSRGTVRGGVSSKVAWGLALAGALGVALWAGARSSRPAEAPPAVTHRAVPAGPARREPRGFVGVAVSESVEIRAPFEGRLEQLTVRPGDAVAAGAELGRLDPRPVQQETAMAEARLAAAEAEVSRLELETREAGETLARYLRSPAGAFSEQELATARHQEQSARIRLTAAQAQVRERRALLAQSRQRLEEATLRAPGAGKVVERRVDPGGWVASGALLLRLLREGPVQVRFAIPEEALGEVRVGSPVWVELPSLGRTVKGHVREVAPEVDAASRMVFAQAAFEAQGEVEGLVVGTAARVLPHGAQAR